MNTLITRVLKPCKYIISKLVYLSLFGCVTLTATTYADDTEVFIKGIETASQNGAPNVMFLMDNSASMMLNYTYITGYDNTVSGLGAGVSGVDRCYDFAIYYSTSASDSLPNCKNNTDYINPTMFQCKTKADDLIRDGNTFGRFLQWHPLVKDWESLQSFLAANAADPANINKYYVDCLPDEGVHGFEGVTIYDSIAREYIHDGRIIKIDTDPITGNSSLALNPLETANDTTSEPYINNLNANPDKFDPYAAAADTSIDFLADTTSLYTFYTGQYLNYANSLKANDPSIVDTNGLDMIRDTLAILINDPAYTGLNFGVLRYNNSFGGQVLFPVTAIKDHILPDGTEIPASVIRDEMIEFMNTGLTRGNSKPLADAMYEGYLYYRGLLPEYGASPNPAGLNLKNLGRVSQIHQVKNDTTSKYYSPLQDISSTCQDNHLILVTRGSPSGDGKLATETNAATAANSNVSLRDALGLTYNCGSGNDPNKTCLDELSTFMSTYDLSDLDNGVDRDGNEVIQNVKVHGITIGSQVDEIIAAAENSGTEPLPVSNPDALEAQLRTMFDALFGETSTFVAPSISVNNFNRLQNLNDLYYSLFSPTENMVWDGNLKKYKLIDGVITDALENPAVNTQTGEFKDNSRSFWTDLNDPDLTTATVVGFDGNETELGGFASRRHTDNTLRSVYTNPRDDSNNVSLTATDNALSEDNALITQSLLGIDALGLSVAEATALHDNLRAWGRGVRLASSIDPDTGDTIISDTPIKFVGDLLHTTPAVLTYYNGAEDITDLDQTIYFGTNNGFLHAAKAKPSDVESIEHFAFMPYEMLQRSYDFYQNIKSPNKIYGLDGPITTWVDETATGAVKDLIINTSLGEKAYIYSTMRRGGRNIYALDVSSRSTPNLLWKIRGGSTTTDPADNDFKFKELGQSWSAVQHATIRNARDLSAPLEVAFFAGGYDENQDAADSSGSAAASTTAAGMGRAIYMVNARTGEHLWQARYSASAGTATESDLPLTKMTYAIPSDLRVLDIDADGFADRLYVGDLGGQLWRFDISVPYDTSSTDRFQITGGVIADLSKTGASDTSTGVDNLRFYSAPSVSLVSNNAYGTYLAIAIGSGYRAHPLDKVLNDKFFMIKDYNVYVPALDGVSGEPVYPADKIMYDDSATEGTSDGSGGTIRAGILDISDIVSPTFADIDGRNGWLIDFADVGEKVINPAITADNKIFFTTFLPQAASAVINCDGAAQLGSSRLYAVSLLTGGVAKPIAYDENTGEPIPQTITDRYHTLATPGISPPAEIFIESTNTGNLNTIADCASSTTVTLLVGTETINPNVCTAPVRTYWHRSDEPMPDSVTDPVVEPDPTPPPSEESAM